VLRLQERLRWQGLSCLRLTLAVPEESRSLMRKQQEEAVVQPALLAAEEAGCQAGIVAAFLRQETKKQPLECIRL